MKRFFIERILHEYGSTLPKNRIYFAHIFGGALILLAKYNPFIVRSLSTYLESASRDGLDTFHLYAAKSRISAHELFILYDFLGWIVSF